eukprot:CAMPEP_0171248402 /NCGR_PEP_ID=MMETSP0790-20130122/48999_1 /TAXON_ID=2925 /ORGANISM="Alexandrium catenella, Strain OF101" /LENGTH=88 /DNA_ID=CAMNT_0011715855 /DNA_START=18 /DNA_END=284 /DNA_ORIENTATION=+
MDPALTKEEQNIGLGVGCFATAAILYLTAVGNHSFISSWLAWGGALPVALLQTIYATLIVTVSLTTVFSWYTIFFKETRESEGSCKLT